MSALPGGCPTFPNDALGLPCRRRCGGPCLAVVLPNSLPSQRCNFGIIGEGIGNCSSMETSDNRRQRRPAPERFRFDVGSGTLWQGSGRVPIRARTAAVLRHLLERRGDVVSRDEL